MGRNLLSMLERATVKHVGGDTSRAKSMAASRVGEAGSFRAPLDHIQNVTPRNHIFSQLIALFEAPKQRALFVLADAGSRDPVHLDSHRDCGGRAPHAASRLSHAGAATS